MVGTRIRPAIDPFLKVRSQRPSRLPRERRRAPRSQNGSRTCATLATSARTKFALPRFSAKSRSALAALDIPTLELRANKADPGLIEPWCTLGYDAAHQGAGIQGCRHDCRWHVRRPKPPRTLRCGNASARNGYWLWNAGNMPNSNLPIRPSKRKKRGAVAAWPELTNRPPVRIRGPIGTGNRAPMFPVRAANRAILSILCRDPRICPASSGSARLRSGAEIRPPFEATTLTLAFLYLPACLWIALQVVTLPAHATAFEVAKRHG